MHTIEQAPSNPASLPFGEGGGGGGGGEKGGGGQKPPTLVI